MSGTYIMGSTEEVTTCDLCGREDLSHTVMVGLMDGDNKSKEVAGYYGSDCISRIWTGSKAPTASQVRTLARKANEAKAAAEREARYAIQEAETAAENVLYYAWIKERFGVTVSSGDDIWNNMKAFRAVLGESFRPSAYKMRKMWKEETS